MPFEPGTVFHVYNQGNARENIFKEEENYHYFLKRYAHYTHPVARTYAFCLMPNHFHFALKVRSRAELITYFESIGKDPAGFENLPGLVSKQIASFLNSYTKSINKRYSRKGRLFLENLKRKPISNKSYFKRLIYYIHFNPVRHEFVRHPSEWLFSSYHIIVSKKKTQLERDKVLSWFGNKDSFGEFHEQQQEIRINEFY